MKSKTSCCFRVSSIKSPHSASIRKVADRPNTGGALPNSPWPTSSDARVPFSRSTLRTLGRQILRMPKTFEDMVVHHAHRLHERVTNRGSDKSKTSLLQITAHGLRFGGFRRHLSQVRPSIHQRSMVYKLPQVIAEAAKLLLNSQERLSVRNRRFNFQPIANDPRIG